MKRRICRWTSILAALFIVLGCHGNVSAADIDRQEKDDTKRCSLTIHKYDMEEMPTLGMPATGTEYVKIPDGAKIAEGVSYKIYKVEDGYNRRDESGIYMEPDDGPVVEGNTAEGGTVTFDNLEQGNYLVVEQESKMLLSLPMKHPNGKGWNYSVHAYPKNAPLLGTVVLKKIERLQSDEENAEGTVEAVLPGAVFILERENADGIYTRVSEEEYKTDSQGQIVLNNLAAGNYRMSEVEAPQGYGLNSAPVSFTIDKAGVSQQDGTLHEGVQVTTTHEGNRLPDQPVCTVNTSSTYKGGSVTWNITPSIPADIESYQSYTAAMHLDEQLTFAGIKIQLDSVGRTGKTDITSQCIAEVSEQTVAIDLTPCKEQLKGQTISIEIMTTVNENAEGYKGDIHSQITVNYINASGIEGKVESEEVSVFVGDVAMPVMKEQKEEIPAWKRWIFRLFGQLQ